MKEYRPSIAAFLLMMAMALGTTALSFFVAPVCAELEIGRGSFGIYYSLMTAAGALSISFLGQYINQKGVRPVILASALWSGTGLFCFSFADSLWMFYLIGGAIGLFGTTCITLCANVIVQQSYSSAKASSLLGIVMSGSGVGGMLVSLVLPGLLEQYGWRNGYRMIGICWMVLGLVAALLLGQQKLDHSIGHRKTPVDGMTRTEALRSPRLYLLMVVLFLLAAACGIQQQIPSLLEGYGFDSSQVGVMVSLFTAALAVGKVLQGLLYGKIGAARGSYVMVTVFAVSFLLLRQKGIIYPALVVLACGMGVYTTLMPTVARLCFGAREFAAIWSILSTAGSVGTLAATPVWGMVYDMTGSYDGALIAAFALLMLAVGALSLCFRKR